MLVSVVKCKAQDMLGTIKKARKIFTSCCIPYFKEKNCIFRNISDDLAKIFVTAGVGSCF